MLVPVGIATVSWSDLKANVPELDFAAEAEDAFHLYRVFQFREEPKLYILKGSLADQVHLEPIDYRASFRRLVG